MTGSESRGCERSTQAEVLGHLGPFQPVFSPSLATIGPCFRPFRATLGPFAPQSHHDCTKNCTSALWHVIHRSLPTATMGIRPSRPISAHGTPRRAKDVEVLAPRQVGHPHGDVPASVDDVEVIAVQHAQVGDVGPDECDRNPQSRRLFPRSRRHQLPPRLGRARTTAGALTVTGRASGRGGPLWPRCPRRQTLRPSQERWGAGSSTPWSMHRRRARLGLSCCVPR